MRISVLIPTIREGNLPALIENIKTLGGVPEEDLEILTLVDGNREGCAATLSKLVAKSKHGVVAFIGDDTLLEKDCLRNAAEYMEKTGAWLVGFNDHHGQKATHWLANKILLEHLPCGEFFYRGYVHNADPELQYAAKRLGKYVWCSTACIMHNHPAFGTGKWDDDYKRVATQEVYEKDWKLFKERCHDDRPLIGFTMIVKNEAADIASTISSVKPYVDYWCILDTGSTDGTQDIIRREFEGVPGELHEEPFVDFSTSRNRALDFLGTKTVYSLMLSGNEKLKQGGMVMRNYLEEQREGSDGDYRIRINFGGNPYLSTRIARTDNGWRYNGKTHEVLVHPYESSSMIAVREVEIFHDISKNTYEKKRVAWKRDLELLQRERLDNPDNTRTAFYLAQTFDSLRMKKQALLAYDERIAMGGWPEEVYEATYRSALFMEELKYPWEEVLARFLRAFELQPNRAEPIYRIALHYRLEERHVLAYIFAKKASEMPFPTENALLMVNKAVYDFEALELVSISAWYAGKMNEGKKAAEQIIANSTPGEPHHDRAVRNLKFYS